MRVYSSKPNRLKSQGTRSLRVFRRHKTKLNKVGDDQTRND